MPMGILSRFWNYFSSEQNKDEGANGPSLSGDGSADQNFQDLYGFGAFDLFSRLEHAGAGVASISKSQLYLLSDSGQLSPAAENSASGTASSIANKTTAGPAPTLVGAAGGLQFDLIWDSSVAAAPSAFERAVIQAAALYTRMFSNPEVINVDVGYGEIAGSALASGALAESESYGYYETYSQVMSALRGDASSSSYQSIADASLPATDPTGGGTFFVARSEAKAWGQVNASSGLDGYIGLSNSSSFDYSRKTPVGQGQYDAIGAIEHELSEVMGRTGAEGVIDGPKIYTPLDLFRYSASGQRDLSVGTATGYFSINSGATNLGTYNNPVHGGDASDWTPSLVGDSYGDGYAGHFARVSSTDLIEDSVLGYRMAASANLATRTVGLA